MMINNTIQSVTGVYAQNGTSSVKGTKKAAATTQSDEIVLSKEAKSFSAILQQMKSMSSEVRQDKVDLYEGQVAAGTYAVDAGNLAGKMLQMRY